MFNIQTVCKTIAEKITVELKLEKDQRAVVEYGLFAIVQTTICILLAMVFGGLLGVLVETLIVAFAAVILRKYSGGVHSENPEYCAAVSTIVAVGGAFIISHISWDVFRVCLVGGIVFILAFGVVYRLAPVASEAKPIRREEKRKMLKKKSTFVLAVYLVISIAGVLGSLYEYNETWLIYITCIYAGTAWQAFTLTIAGHKLIAKVDGLFNKLLHR